MHGSLGLWLAFGLLMVSATGLTWSTYAGSRVDMVVDAVDGNAPSLTVPAIDAPATAERIAIDRVVDIAARQGMSGALTVTPPGAPTEPFLVAESSEGLPIRKTEIAVDSYTGAVLAQQGWDDYPLAAKLTTLGIGVHGGTLFGLANQIALAMLAVGTLVLLTLGYRMWWIRRPPRGGPPTAPRPIWRALDKRTLVALLIGSAYSVG